MQLVTQKKKIQSNIKGKKFGIEANAKTFQVLSDKLYTNKIRAVVRELSTNAYDAHVEAGKENIPFTVHLPNDLEPYFYVQDYGTGMSEEKVLTLYSSYFGSDKTTTNDSTGMFGLGSKSPFAVEGVESFTVESIYNSKKKIYTCFLDEENIPSIAKIAEFETDEENGIKVQIEVPNNSYYKWLREAGSIFRPFTLRPTVIGVENFNVLKIS